jgi:hypothetical protein
VWRSSETAAFWLGAQFGFSFTSDVAAEDTAANERELRRVAECATIARVAYEKAKRSLELRDSDVVSILKINAKKFIAWKARVSTIDTDRSVEDSLSGQDL